MLSPQAMVVGGGIGGLAAAAFLRRAGIEADVCEQASELSEIGAGLMLAPNAARLLRRLGLHERLREVAVRLEAGWEFRRWADGRVLSAQRLGDECVRQYGEDTWTVHRADLLELLRSAVPAERIHLGRRCTGADGDGRVRFADGSAERADLVVAADGIHSVLRGLVTTPRPPWNSGVRAWRCLVPADAAPDLARRPVQTVWLGPGRHLVHYPVSGGKQINIVACTPATGEDVESWTSEGRPEDLAAEFADWDPRVRELLSAPERVGCWALLDREPIDTWVAGRLVLLGDAAHPMLPLFAQGAMQAIEDAAALAACLTGSADTPAALGKYQRLRAPRTARVQEVSRARVGHHWLPDGPEQRARDAAFAAADPLRDSAWLYAYDAEQAMRAGS